MTGWLQRHVRFRVAGPTEPTNLQLMAMVYGCTCLLLSLIVYLLYLSQKGMAEDAASRAQTQAVVSGFYMRHGRGGPYKEWRLDYTRQTPKGPVACNDAVLTWPRQNLEIGKVIEIYPRPDSCHQAVDASSVGKLQPTSSYAVFWLVIGLAMSGGGYFRYRRRRQRAMTAGASVVA